MRLKRIKLAGFKSFVEPTSIPFPGSMTAVVGPNGCGKSNVIDAVRWVLGESSAKNLRGDAMTDVIFNGSSARKPVGQCSVELVFENAKERLSGEFANYSELSVKRIVTRDAQSNYFLNGTKCRRRDVTDLFLGTGLGPRSYAIIEQGMISRLIESKPQELRVFIEEAAGISKYKERRKETETRIRHTLENLERLTDVRSELGQQIAKLERQAAAAQRYTQLKAKERTLKSELAMVRYLAIQHKLDVLQKDLDHADTDYEALKAQLQGDEAGIEKYRAQQTELKLDLDSLQETIFALSTKITRSEEAKQFKTRRLSALQEQSQTLSQKRSELDEQQLKAQDKIEIVAEQLAELEPQLAVIEEQHIQALENRDAAEEALQAFTQQRRSDDETYHSKKRQAQTNHSQIQSTMSMQMRTQQRIRELEEELRQIEDPYLQSQYESLLEQTELATAQKLEAEQELADAEQNYQTIHQQRREKDEVLLNVVESMRTLEAKRNGLLALQSDLREGDSALAPLWQSLKVQAGCELAVETVLAHMGDPVVSEVIDYDEESFVESGLPQGKRVVSLASFTQQKTQDSLSQKINSERVPQWFNWIVWADDETQARALLASLDENQSVITADGLWLSNHWCIYGPGNQANGALQRQAEIEKLSEELEAVAAKKATQDEELAVIVESESNASKHVEMVTTSLKQAESQLVDLTQKQGLIAMQLEQNKARRDKVDTDIAQQQELLEQEQEQLERLSEQVEELEAEILELEIQQQNADETAERLQDNVAQTRHQYETVTQQKHAQTLSVQQQNNEYQSLQRDLSRINEQLAENTSQAEHVQQETLELTAPEQDHSEQLQQWLTEKQQKETDKTQLQQQLSEIEALLNQAQQGQQGIRLALEQKQKVRESLLLEAEGLKARANSILEQLQETGKSIKETMEHMPENAEEAEWAQQLEQTTASIKRLGAVNLAAVDEYKVQAERKAHLDAQDADLTEALETLQSAIRKIDKETRTRFSQTFEQVNNDLKALFPKVFGGGSAYLALTDDDLLETGVTIMARPPGKKNSTIHLLSGGEKALTALSLVFAIFRLNPAPFCLLDEVDAPLDDANVGRFCKLVSEMSDTVQFIYITHNKIAMEMASHLTGVTMAEPGVSRMVAVDVEEAVTLAQA